MLEQNSSHSSASLTHVHDREPRGRDRPIDRTLMLTGDGMAGSGFLGILVTQKVLYSVLVGSTEALSRVFYCLSCFFIG